MRSLPFSPLVLVVALTALLGLALDIGGPSAAAGSPSAIVITASPNPAVFGRAVTFTATVRAVSPATGVPTGTVTFSIDAAPVATVPLNAAGQAALTTGALSVGAHVITASYGGDANFDPVVAGGVTQTVNKAATTTTLTSSVNPTVTGQPVTLTATVTVVAPGAAIPTGVVTFRDGATVLGTAVLSPPGQATLTTAFAAGAHSLTASFGGDGNTNASTSPARAQTVAKAATSLASMASASTAVVGEPVTLMAMIGVLAPGAGTPTGGVTFLNGTTALGTVALNAAGQAVLTTSALPIGPRAISARYAGTAGFAPSTSSTLTVTIAKASTATVVSASPNPAASRQPVILTATVAVLPPGGGTPTGSVTFFDGPAALGTGVLNALGRATLTTSTLSVGTHGISASYGGSASFNGSLSTVFPETIVRATSATTLTAAPNPAVTGRPVLLTATVNVVAPGAGTPTGMVTFLDGGTALATVPLNGARQATLTTSALSVGAHPLSVSYGGDGNVAPSMSSVVTETITKVPTTTALTSSANPSVVGRAVTFTAKVSVVAPGTGTPTGTVTFRDGATPLATVPLDAARTATLTTSALAVGAHPLTVVYNGDAGFATSTSPVLTETIGKAATRTVVTSSATPVVHGMPVTFTATVTVVAPGAGAPTGFVTFLDGATTLGVVPLGPLGQAVLTTTTLVGGARSITARYGGDGSFTTSTSPAVIATVTKASTSLALATSASSAVVGQPVVLTATISVLPPGAGTPTGGVTFFNGAVALGTAPLNAVGQATLITSTLTVGPHTIGARYVGDASFTTSTAPTLTVTIAKASTGTIVTASANPAPFRQPVTLTAAVTVLAPGAGKPTGTVTFFDGPTTLGTGALSATGRATLTTSTLAMGAHAIMASYGGAAGFNGSVSTVLPQTITRAASATALTVTPNPSVTGRPVVLTATVSVVVPGSGTPTGSVTFFDGATALGTVTLSAARQATLTTSAFAVGAHALTAGYVGDANVAPSTSSVVTETINKGNTTALLTASVNPAGVGQPVTFTATVNPLAPAAGVPTGAVTFMDGAVVLGTASLNAMRQATLTTSALAPGTHPLTARYAGDAGFAPSTSTLLSAKVSSPPPVITSTSTATFAPGKAGQAFTVTTTGIPTNTITRTGVLPSGVTFTDNHNNTATIAGTPAAGTQTASPYVWAITAASGIPPNAVQSFTFRVVCPVITVSGTIPALTFNAPMSAATFTQTGGNGAIAWTASGLPAGITINSGSGQVTGTPTAAGTFAVTITATDAGGCKGSAQQTVTVAPVVAGLTYSGLVDNTRFVITGGAMASPAAPFVAGTVRLGSNAQPSGAVTTTAGTFATTAGGSVTIAADGTFLYTPKANPGAAATTSDSFTYTVVSAAGGGAVTSAPATASLTLAGRVWYVRNNGAAGNGQSQSPFSTLASAVSASTAGDTIFVYRGNGMTTGLATASVLKAGQRLIGEGAALVVNGATLVPAGEFPLLGNTVTLASGVTIAGVDLSTGTSGGLSGAGVTGLNVAIRDLTTITGTAVNIGGAGNSGTLSFRTISASGGANGIVVQNLAGSFTVTGDGVNTAVGGNASGGTISNMTGADSITQAAPFAGVGIYLSNVQNVTLRRMAVTGTNQNYGIRGLAVGSFTLEYSMVSGSNGTAPVLAAPEEAGEGSVYFGNSTTNGLATSGTFTNNVIQGGRARNLSIVNTAAGLTTLLMRGNTFGLNQDAADADQNVSVEALGAGASISAIVGGTASGEANTFAGSPGDVASFTGQAGTVMDVVFQGNTVSNTHAQNVFGGGGVTLATDGAMTFDVDANLFSGADGSALTLFKAASGSLLSGTISNNTIGVNGVAASGSKSGNGIFVAAAGTGTMRLAVTGNTILQYGTAGIYADNTDGSYTANFTITGNTTAQPSAGGFAGLVLTNGAPGSNDTINVCAGITGNNFSAGDPTNTSDVFIVASGAAAGHTFRLPGLSGTPTLTNVAGFIGGNNPPAATVLVQADAPATAAAFTGGAAACPLP